MMIFTGGGMKISFYRGKIIVSALLLCLVIVISSSLTSCKYVKMSDTPAYQPYERIVAPSGEEYSFYTYEDMEEDLFALRDKYPDLVSVESAGQSLDGREIYYAVVGNDSADRQMIINAGIHGREYINCLLVMTQLEYYLDNYNTGTFNGKTYAELFSAYKIYVIPMLNPDGVMLSEQGIESVRSPEIRKNIESIYESDCKNYASYKIYGSLGEYLKMWKANAAGVDLNRNFDIDDWSKVKTGITVPSEQDFKGKSPASEPEVKAFRTLVQKMDNLVCCISFHSQEGKIYWNCGQEGELKEKTLQLATALSDVSGYSIQKSFSSADATLDDWCVLNMGVPSVNIETGTGKCPLPFSQFETIYNENYLAWAVAASVFGGEK